MPQDRSLDMPAAVADGLIDKLRGFADQLSAEERRLLAALLAPGIAAAYAETDDLTTARVEWSAARLPEHLRASIRGRALHIEGW
jgi:hypothetical protein